MGLAEIFLLIRSIPDIIRLIKSIVQMINELKEEHERNEVKQQLREAIRIVNKDKDTKPLEVLLNKLAHRKL